MYGYHHQCPSCRGRVAYGTMCCGNPIADMLVMEGVMDGNMGEVIAGEMMGSNIGFAEAVIAEEIATDFGW